MDYLARREHPRGELLDKLQRAGFDAAVAVGVVDRLVQEGLQDDRRFVESFVRSRISQGKGPVRIRFELVKKGVDGSLVDETLSAQEEDWEALARAARVRRFGEAAPPDFRARARQMRFLQYRGFDRDQIEAAMSAAEDAGR